MAMTGKHFIRNVSIGLVASAYLCFGQPDSSSGQFQDPAQPVMASVPGGASNEMKSTQSMFFALDEGQVMRGADPIGGYKAVPRLWQQRMYFHFTNDMSYMERLRLILSIECQLTFSMRQEVSLPQTLNPLFFFYPNDIELKYSFGNLDRPWLQLSAGYFPYKYNPDAKDLGEYLIRDGAYPTYIITNFEFAQTRELGFHLNGFLGNPAIDQARWDLMLTSETHFWPLQDWTLSAVVSNNLFNFFDAGVGASWQRLISVDESKTTPKLNPTSRYINENGDSSSYTYRAIKLMGRASIAPMRFIPDFKIPFAPFFGDKPFFGKEDLKIYGEIGVLGLTNYTAYKYDSVLVDGQKVWKNQGLVAKKVNYYDSLADRMPIMAGINLPTNPLLSYGILPLLLTKWLKDEAGDDVRTLSWITLPLGLGAGALQHYLGWDLGLDVLSLEFEWMSTRYPDDNGFAIMPGTSSPIPQDELGRETNLMNYKLGSPQKVKYALYFKKTFMDQKFAISGLVARDHMRPAVHAGANPKQTVNDDFLITKSMWWWTLRLSANF
jgi:hypothetical protein